MVQEEQLEAVYRLIFDSKGKQPEPFFIPIFCPQDAKKGTLTWGFP